MAAALIGPILAMLLAIWPLGTAQVQPSETAVNSAGGGVLAERLAHWPDWSLPAPLPRPGRRDLVYPDSFEGSWEVRSEEMVPGSAAPLTYRVRFARNQRGELVGDRAFNAAQVGKALLGPQLLAVANDPANPNRQLASLRGELSLESTVVGRRSQAGPGGRFIADELALQVVHGPGGARISRVETLTRYEPAALSPGQPVRLHAMQWQATYPSPENGLAAVPLNTHSFNLDLQQVSTPPLTVPQGQAR